MAVGVKWPFWLASVVEGTDGHFFNEGLLPECDDPPRGTTLLGVMGRATESEDDARRGVVDVDGFFGVLNGLEGRTLFVIAETDKSYTISN